LRAFLSHDELSSIAPKDVRRWTDQRQADGVSVRTIRNVDLAAFPSILEFGIERDSLVANPAPRVKVRRPC